MKEQEFLDNIKKVKNSRNHKVKNSYGVYDGYKYYRRNKPKDSKYVLTESQYFAIIRRINELFVDSILSGSDIILPCKFGRIELRKYAPKIIYDGKVIKTNLPINWDKTLKLWYEDKNSYKNKVLIRMEEKEIFKLYYNKTLAEYNNKSFYQINFNRDLKKKLKVGIKNGNIDAFNF